MHMDQRRSSGFPSLLSLELKGIYSELSFFLSKMTISGAHNSPLLTMRREQRVYLALIYVLCDEMYLFVIHFAAHIYRGSAEYISISHCTQCIKQQLLCYIIPP